MELEILPLIKFSSCRQPFRPLAPPPATDGDGEKWSPSLLLSYALILVSLKEKINERDVGKEGKYINSRRNDRPVSKQFTRSNICAKRL